MTTLKQHQEAMVDLLANGSAIPASASRLAHAMHDVLEVLTGSAMGNALKDGFDVRCGATTPGLNDRALAEDIKAVRPKQVSAEQRVKQLENTVKQLRESNAELKDSRKAAEERVYELEELLKETQRLQRNAERAYIDKKALLKLEQATIKELQERIAALTTDSAPAVKLPEQSGVRKEDTRVCEHDWVSEMVYGYPTGVAICTKCGVIR